jgi:hypothetical protein
MAKKILLAALGLLVVITGVAAYLLFFTAFPFKMIESGLKASGVQITNLQGSLNSGMSIDALEVKNEKMDLALKNARFSYSGFTDLFRGEFNISEINLDQMKLHLKSAALQGQAGAGSTQQPGAEPAAAQKPWKGSIRIQVANIKNVEITSDQPMVPAIKFDLMNVTEFVASAAGMKLQRAVLKSSLMDMSVPPIEFAAGAFKLQGEIKGMLKPTLIQELKAELPLALKADKGPAGWSVQLVAADGKLRLVHQPGVFLGVETANFTPNEIFQTGFPLSKMSVKGKAGDLFSAMGGQLKWEGEFYLGESLFVFPEIPAAAEGQLTTPGQSPAGPSANFDRAPERFEIRVKPTGIQPAALKTGTAVLVLDSNRGKPVADTLAHLRFQKPLAQLSPEERNLVDRDAPYFEAGAGLQPLLQEPKKQTKSKPSSKKRK